MFVDHSEIFYNVIIKKIMDFKAISANIKTRKDLYFVMTQ